MALIPYDAKEGRPSIEMAITIDRQGRLYLNKALQRKLGCEGKGIKLYLAYDHVNKRIGIAKPGMVRLPHHRPVAFDKSRAYAMVRSFLHYFRIPYDQPYRYVYDGKEDGWWTFRLEGYEAPDDTKNDR